MPADIDLRLRRIRDRARLASILKGAGNAAAQAEVAAVSHKIDLREARELLR